MVWSVKNDELERIWKDVVVAPGIRLNELRKIPEMSARGTGGPVEI
jgi:hypothetical protein